MATLTLDSLGKTYGKNTRAVTNINAHIADGEFIVIVGPSGCGKSTLLRMIAGLESITDGTLYIDDQPVNQLEPKERGIAMVFQNYALYPHMSNRENIGYALKLAGISKEERNRRVEAVAEKLQLTPYLERKPSQLSGGQRQRVAMGRAIVREPKIFLFDEPLSNLDAKLRVEMRKQIKKLQRELGITSLYVTHDQVEAMTMADRLIVLKDGEIQQIGKPLELYQTPANRFVAEFIGSPAMNILENTDRNTAGELIASENQLGIRPEHIDITADENGLAFTIELTENLGHHQQLIGHLTDSGHNLIVQTAAQTYHEGETIRIKFPSRHLHRFTPDGLRISA